MSWRGILCILALLTCLAREAQGSPETDSRNLVMIGGSFEEPPVKRFFNGSRSTILYPASIARDGTVTPLSKAPGSGPGAWDSLVAESRERASLLLSTLEPEMKRDENGVIQAAVLKSPDPATATCVLAPGFLERFRAVFGPELIVAAPSRTTLYVFPKLANRLPEAANTVRDEYLVSPCPVTTEFLEISGRGIRAVGDFRQER